MRTTVAALVVLVLWSTTLVTQAQDLAEGWVVTVTGDTLDGWFEGAPWTQAPRRVSFRKRRSGPTVDYGPADLDRFSVRWGRRYVSRPVTLSAEGGASPRFLAVLVEGPLTLLEHEAGVFFVQDGEETPVRLQGGRRTVREGGGVLRRVADRRYRAQLRERTAAWPALQRATAYLAFNRIDLTRHVRGYNRCVCPEAPGCAYRKGRLAVTVGPVLSAGPSHVSLSGRYRVEGAPIAQAEMAPHLRWGGGLSLMVRQGSGRQRWPSRTRSR